MAYCLYKGEEERQMQYILDKDTDVSSLPTSDGFGSVAYSIDSHKVYMLDSSKTWKEVSGIVLSLNK